MNLFELEPLDVLPQDGQAFYHGKIFKKEEADRYFNALATGISWNNDEVVVFGKKHVTKRLVAWYGEQAYEYRYSNSVKIALEWTNELKEIKYVVEAITASSYNSCLLNLYPSGQEGMGWHSDNEKSIVKNSDIASISFGSERTFLFKHKSLPIKTSLNLEHGSLLLMRNEIQHHWLHRLPPTKKQVDARINLTFRSMR